MRSRKIIGSTAATAVAVAAVAAATLRRFVIADASMEPVLRHGDWVMARRLTRPPQPGDIVVFRNDQIPDLWLVKRVVENRPEGASIVLGDNRSMSSGDSRILGPISHSAMGWKVVWRYWPSDRIGWV